MASLDDIVTVQIGLNTTGVSRADFGTSLIVGPHMSFAESVRAYTKYDDAVTDGLPKPILTAVEDAFSQTPHPKYVKVGRRAVNTAIITFTVANLTAYTLTVKGTVTETYTYTSDATATAAEIAAGLAALVLADTNETITATVVGDTLQLAWISQSNLQAVTLGANMAWDTIVALNSVAADMAVISTYDNAWYGVISSDRTQAIQLEFAAYIETQEKIFGLASSEAGILVPGTTTDVISQLQTLNYYRTFASYSGAAATEYPDSAWMNKVFPLKPGSETWSLKKLAGVTADKLNATQRGSVLAKGGNTFEYYSPTITLTGTGQVVAGEWIDVIRGRDWLKDLIQSNLTTLMINRAKVPYTDAGIQLCASNLRKSLQEGVTAGFIAPDEVDADGNTVPGFTITVPLSQDIDSAVKATRILTLEFSARLAGAIHVANITGAVGYELA